MSLRITEPALIEKLISRGLIKQTDVQKLKDANKITPAKSQSNLKFAIPARKEEKTRSKREKEGEEQAELIDSVRDLNPLFKLLIHIPNGGSRRNKYEGWRLKKQGVRKGVSDLFLPVARGGFFGLWIEFKAAPPFDSPITPEQTEWLEEMKDQGFAAYLCKGVEEALHVLVNYLDQLPTLIATKTIQ